MTDLTPYTERRVRVKDYGRIPLNDPRLVPVPSAPGTACKLHACIEQDLLAMFAACKAETGVELRVISGCRAHRWESREAYEAIMIEKYGSVAEGRKWVAFDSPHETGLVPDLVGGGLTPNSKTAAKQKKTPAFLWLKANAHRFRFTPYLPEPWHWEHAIPLMAWQTGTMIV
jgi:LAS superfamily LD-carboxypeptidase LdcB